MTNEHEIREIPREGLRDDALRPRFGSARMQALAQKTAEIHDKSERERILAVFSA